VPVDEAHHVERHAEDALVLADRDDVGEPVEPGEVEAGPQRRSMRDEPEGLGVARVVRRQ